MRKPVRLTRVVALTLVLAAVGLAAPREGPPRKRVRECQANLKAISVGLEMFATDHSGAYPRSLGELTPLYLSAIPKCPSADRDTYRAGYKTGKDAPLNSKDMVDYFHLACSGTHHAEAGLAANLPALNCQLGLLPEMPYSGTAQEARKQCEENLKTIATILELYSTDNNGRYPESIAVLSESYLPRMPRCPASGTDTYSATLKFGPRAPHNPGDYRDYFYLYCSGSHKGANPPQSPAYDSVRGLTTRGE